MDGYGRYIDEKDGMPRWNLPPKQGARSFGERSRMIYEAIRELYPDHGSTYVRERLGVWIDDGAIRMRAKYIGVRLSERGRKALGERAGRKMRRVYMAERTRVLGGMPQKTGWRVLKTVPDEVYSWRRKLRHKYGYVYGEPPFEMLYDGNTKRRMPPFVYKRRAVNSEEVLSRRFGFVFRSVDEVEEEEP